MISMAACQAQVGGAAHIEANKSLALRGARVQISQRRSCSWNRQCRERIGNPQVQASMLIRS